MNLINYGWSKELEELVDNVKDKDYSIGRVIAQYNNIYRVVTNNGEIQGEISGRMKGVTIGMNLRWDKLPLVGDWVYLREYPREEKAVIHGVLPRKSIISRKAAGKGVDEQYIAANLDYIFIVTSLNNEFNLRRIERYLILGWESGAIPVIILTKADLCDDIPDKIREVQSIAPSVSIHVISSIKNEGVEELKPYFYKYKTVGLLGSSGVGKSTLINCLKGEDIQRVNEIRKNDDRGKHTTTHRELIQLPDGGLVIDTPGMRGIQMLEIDDGISQLYNDIEDLAKQCRFNDCIHESEPGCAVKGAVDEGTLQLERLTSYNKMQREVAELSLKVFGNIAAVEREKGKRYADILRNNSENRNKGILRRN